MTTDSSSGGAHGDRYGAVAVLMHWAIAILIIANVIIGLDFPHHEPGTPFPPKPLLPLHISLGLSVLVLSCARLAWRLAHRPPPHPPTMQHWEVLLANAAHIAFYVLIVAMPLSGWLILSAHSDARWLSLFGVPWPPLPVAGAFSESTLLVVHDAAVTAHSWLTIQILLGLLALHVGAVIKHQFFDKHRALQRMLPRFSRSHP